MVTLVSYGHPVQPPLATIYLSDIPTHPQYWHTTFSFNISNTIFLSVGSLKLGQEVITNNITHPP